LIKYLEERKFAIDTSPEERCMRRVKIGRKNNMLAGLEEGAKNSAMVYSFFDTCKAPGLEHFERMKVPLKNALLNS